MKAPEWAYKDPDGDVLPVKPGHTNDYRSNAELDESEGE